ALLTGYGLFGLHPPRSWRYWASWPVSASLSSGVLTFLQGGCPPQRWLGMITSSRSPREPIRGPTRNGPGVRSVTPGPRMLARRLSMSQEQPPAGDPAGGGDLPGTRAGLAHVTLMYAAKRRA